MTLIPSLQRRMLFCAAAAFSALAVSLAPSGALAQARVLTVGSPFAPLSLDPATSGNGRAGVHLMPAYEPLVRERADGTMEPALATAWKVSPDFKEVTFTLRKDAKFSDGEAVNAAAVKKSFEYWRNKKGPFTVNFLAVTAVDVLDEHRISIKMSEPQPSIVGLFNGYWRNLLQSQNEKRQPFGFSTNDGSAGNCRRKRQAKRLPVGCGASQK